LTTTVFFDTLLIMPTWNLRNIPEDLAWKAKKEALNRRMTLQDFVISLVREAIEVREFAAEVSKGTPVEAIARIRGIERKPKESDASLEIRAGFCSVHEKPMKDFGTKWVCEGPPQHSVPK
jgi:hypothetical protein